MTKDSGSEPADARLALLQRPLSEPRWARTLVSAVGTIYVIERAPEAGFTMAYRSSVRGPPGKLSTQHVLERAPFEGFRWLGITGFKGLVGQIVRDAWVSDDGMVRMSSRRAVASGVEGQMSPYYMSTTFSDGSVILTWAVRPPPLPSTDRVQSQGGSGDVGKDLSAHRAAVVRHQERFPDAHPIEVRSIDDCVALNSYFDVHCTTRSQIQGMATMVLMRWTWRALLLAAVAFVVFQLIVRS